MSYAIVGYAITVASVGAYAGWTLVRGRRLSARVAPERRRWT